MAITFIFASLCNVFAQSSGVIEFGVQYEGMMIDTSYATSMQVKDFLLERDANAKRALKGDYSYYTVKFNEKGSITQFIPQMHMDYQMSPKEFLSVECIYKNEDLYNKNEYRGEVYYVETEEHFDWKLKPQYKTILGYKCQKAETVLTSSKKKNKTLVEVWFTSAIPYHYGPYRFYGVPGFILEVNALHRRHYARKIILKNNLNIDFPPDDKFISREEYKAFFK